MIKRPLTCLIQLIFGVLLVSCGSRENQSEEKYPGLTLQVDTVRIDPKDELLFIKQNLSISGLSKDQRYLYNFDTEQHQLEKIDLDNLMLDQKIPFEKEGPNGLNSIHSLRTWDKERIFFSTWKGPKLFKQNGQLDRAWEVNLSDLSGDVLSDKESLMSMQINPNNHEEIYGLVKAFGNEVVEFARVDLDHKQLLRYALPAMDKLRHYTASLNDGENYAYYEAETYLKIVDGGVLLGAETDNEWYFYNSDSNSISAVTSNSQWLDNENQSRGNELATAGEFSRFFKQYLEGPHYYLPVYDEQNQRYLRLYYENYFDSEEVEGLFPQPSGANVYLAIYDKDLKLIQETQLPFLTQKPSRYFTKGGMLWIFINLEDDMGFVRLKLI